jgi:peptidyl-prolyl cis-trans isomerase B (cyclophilin B)
VVALDTERTPGTANNFVSLARSGYYDDTLLFRTDPSIGIIQGGSPSTDSPSDPGPGYTIPDEGGSFTYVPGQLVMARSQGPDSAGAQFFFSVDEAVSALDGQGTYVVFGEVTEGLDILEQILASHEEQPDNPLGGAPNPPVTVTSVTITEA